jgi:hypothetical protein
MAGRAPVVPKKPKTSPPLSSGSLEDQIRQRAHEIYLERGALDGTEVEDWLQAENEIRQKQS